MTIPKRHHTVPQLLLRNFASGKKRNRIWTYDKWEDRAFQSTVSDASVQTRFYEVDYGDGYVASWEEGLAALESKAAKVIRKVLETMTISELSLTERVTLAALVSAQWLRTSSMREALLDVDRAVEERFRSEGTDPTTVRLVAPGINPSTAPLYRKMSTDDAAEIALEIMSENNPEIAAHLTMRCWSLMWTEKPVLFVSDSPVCLHNSLNRGPFGNLGIMSEGIEVYMPLSSQVCLGIFCPIRYGEMPGSYSLDHGNVSLLNRLQTSFASRFIYARTQDFHLAEQFLREYPERRKPLRMTVV